MCCEDTTYEELFFFILLGFASLHKWCPCDSYTPNNESFHEEVELILLWTHFWQCLQKKEQVDKEKILQLTGVEHLALTQSAAILLSLKETSL